MGDSQKSLKSFNKLQKAKASKSVTLKRHSSTLRYDKQRVVHDRVLPETGASTSASLAYIAALLGGIVLFGRKRNRKNMED